jgi:hypothetical protein
VDQYVAVDFLRDAMAQFYIDIVAGTGRAIYGQRARASRTDVPRWMPACLARQQRAIRRVCSGSSGMTPIGRPRSSGPSCFSALAKNASQSIKGNYISVGWRMVTPPEKEHNKSIWLGSKGFGAVVKTEN